MKKLCSIVVVAAALALSATGASAADRIFVDSTGRSVSVPEHITRIAPSGSLAQVMLYTMAPDEMVGWSKAPSGGQARYIPEKYRNLPAFGQFYGKNVQLNLEALIAARPQVIIDLGDRKPSAKEDMDTIQQRTGIPTVFIEATLATFQQAYHQLGELLGQSGRAEVLARVCERTLAMAKALAAEIPEDQRVSVYFGVGPTGLDGNARGSLHATPLELVGAVNALVVSKVSHKGGGNPVNLEELARLQPDVIILGAGGGYESVAGAPGWRVLKAVREGRYYEIPSGSYSWLSTPPSVNQILGVHWLCRLLYPKLYKENLADEAQKFYKLFWHYDLSADEAQALLVRSLPKPSE